ncbi:GyrI-like domain-containing protein [Bacillus sp. 165]|uniref:GyrI-like domain-containing protein n=1 Tax=Bacillus sp. 165 TaxID=1529117 RepID=UPI001ADCB2FB|nr:AraC family transcriptional regulator [Bacillus sp. 165]
MQYIIVERDGFQVVGIKKEFSCVNGENLIGIPRMWAEVTENGTDNVLFKLNNGQIKGVLGVCVTTGDTKAKQLMDYWIAVEYEGNIPEGLSKLEIQASKWAVFEVHGPMPDAMQKAWKQIFSEWFPSSGYQHAGTPDLEVYTGEDSSNPNLYSEIWVPVK